MSWDSTDTLAAICIVVIIAWAVFMIVQNKRLRPGEKGKR